jgi:branched-chain amino acid aminotransferase
MVLVDGATGVLPTDDPALTLGFAVFETLRTYDGVPFRLDAHLARLAHSATFCGIPYDEAAIRADIATVLTSGPHAAKLNVYLTGGGHRVVRAEPLDLARVGAPVRVVTRPWCPPAWLPGTIKHTSRLAWVLAARGVDEVLWEDRGGWTEANRSNVFVVRGGVLLTPADDGRILRGVTRAALLDAARSIDLPVSEGHVPVGPCDELYLASTLKELAPVVEVDGQPGPGGGPVGAALLAAFRARIGG